MYVVKPISEKHTEALSKLAFSASEGITNLPKNKKILRNNITASLKSFTKHVEEAHDEVYFFALEEISTGVMGGICAIHAKTGTKEPKYHYAIETIHPSSKQLALPSEIKILHPKTQRNGPTEICALYLNRKHRKEGLGRLLSLSRLLFIAAHPERFQNIVIAELRGCITADNRSPFWEGLGRCFWDVDFHTVMKTLETGRSFIPSILPSYPIYLNTLPKSLQEAAGKAHENSLPALNMLLHEGFKITNEIDIFDGGPQVSVQTDQIKSIQASRVSIVQEIIRTPITSEVHIICNERLDFRVCYGALAESREGGVALMSETAEALEVTKGDRIRYVPKYC